MSVTRNKDLRLKKYMYLRGKERKKFLIEASSDNKIEENLRRNNSVVQ